MKAHFQIRALIHTKNMHTRILMIHHTALVTVISKASEPPAAVWKCASPDHVPLAGSSPALGGASRPHSGLGRTGNLLVIRGTHRPDVTAEKTGEACLPDVSPMFTAEQTTVVTSNSTRAN